MSERIFYSKLNDYELIDLAIKINDQKAYRILANRYKQNLIFYLFRRTHNQQDAEDLTLIIINKAFEKLKEFNPNYKFNAWLYIIAKNSLTDFLRNKKCRLLLRYTDEYIDEQFNLKIINPEEVLIKKQKHKRIRDAILSLTENQQDYFELYMNGFKYEEIAKTLNKPLGTVKANISRAKNKLRIELKDLA